MSTGKNSLSQADIDARLNEFETRIESLRLAYDRYFNGVDRRPPDQLRKDVVRVMHELEHKTFIRNTAQKFRLQSLTQRFNSYKGNYWDRVLRQIEEGTYVRDRIKAKRNQERRKEAEGPGSEQQGPLELDLELDAVDSLDDFAHDLMQAYGNNASSAPPVAQAAPPAQPHYAMRETAAALPSVMSAARAAAAAAAQAPAQAVAPAQLSDEELRARKIRELQAKLGLPATGVTMPGAPPTRDPPQDSDEARRLKLAAIRRELERRADSAPPATPQPQPARPAPAASVNHDDERARQVYRNLIEAKRRCNESTDNLSYDQLARSLQQQRERMRQTHNASDVDFKVVIKDGRAFLKPEPKF